jgi:hypothetical protein
LSTKHAFSTLLVLLACLFVHAAQADLTVNADSLILTGEIKYGDDDVAMTLLTDNANIKRVIIMESPGGSAEAGLGLGELIALRDLPVHVFDRCASACAFAAIGGETVTFHIEGNLGVHSPRYIVDDPAEQVPAAHVASTFDYGVDLLRREWTFARRVLGEERGNLFAWLVHNTHADDMHWLTTMEKVKLGFQIRN